jgi:hypothetical protein
MSKSIEGHGNSAGWASHPKLIERARIVLSVSLSKRPPGEIVRIIMDWLDDADLYEFCHRYLDEGDLETIYRR